MPVKINISPKKASKKGNTFLLTGDLTIANANYIKQELMKALEKYAVIKLEIDEVERLDLSVLQLIYAFRRAALSSDKEIHVSINLPEDVEQMVRLSGLEKMYNQSI
jgi:ABC-type transporter Mla MlaB component